MTSGPTGFAHACKIVYLQSTLADGGTEMQLDQIKRREFITMLGGAAAGATVFSGN
jgi:hypothetical protein